MVVSKIAENDNHSNIYSIIFDSTQDVNKKECTAVLLRYVENTDVQGTPKNNVKPENV